MATKRKKLTEMERMERLFTQIEKNKERLGLLRVKIRDQVYDVNQLAESMDDGFDALHAAVIELRGALDIVSEYV